MYIVEKAFLSKLTIEFLFIWYLRT